VQKARAVYRIQRSELVPSVSATAGADISRVPEDLSGTGSAETVEQYSVNLGLAAWELDLFGRLASLKKSALERFLATEEARRATRVALVAEVASAWLTLAADTESLALAEATQQAQEESFDLIRQSRDLGMATDLDLSQARSQVESARADRARLAGLVALDRNALALLVGAPVPERLLPDGLPADRTGPETAVLGLAPGLPSEVLLSRPDILAAEHRLKAANANIGAARAAFFPRISLTAAGGVLSGELESLFDGSSGTWSFVPRVSVPIFTGGALTAGLDSARVDRELAVAEYEKAIQTAFREVGDALSLRRTLADQLEARRALVDALAEAHRLSEVRFDAGLDGYLGVLVAQQSLYSARQGLVATRLAEQANLVRLFRVLGGGAADGEAPARVDPLSETRAAGDDRSD
jgi:multidrug efflux system outer membrane protein